MRSVCVYACLIAGWATAASAGVSVSSPGSGATVASPVSFVASASTGCSKGVASMGIYVNNKLTFVVKGSSLSTKLALNAGTYNAVVEEWDYCGGASFTPVPIKVGGTTLTNIQASGGWKGWGELAPAYEICSSCSPRVTWAMSQTGGATKFDIGGTVPYSDVLWSNPIIGQGSTQGIPDNSQTLVPSLKNFVYDAWFFSSNLPASQVLEFDISEFFSGKSFIFGHQCNLVNGHQWDIWDNVNNKWVQTGIPCRPANNAWNHGVRENL